MAVLGKIVHAVNRYVAVVAGIFMVAMMLLTCSNIFLRMVWLPLKGTYELVGIFGAMATAFALGYTQIHRGHISVDILIARYSARTRRYLGSLNSAICMVLFGFVGWQMTKWSTTLAEKGDLTETLRIPYYPYVYAVALGFALLSVLFLFEFLQLFFPDREDQK